MIVRMEVGYSTSVSSRTNNQVVVKQRKVGLSGDCVARVMLPGSTRLRYDPEDVAKQ